MATRTITVHDHCTTVGCGRVLYSMCEGERGTCSSCWVSSMPKDTKKSLNRLIASAFNGSGKAEQDKAVDVALVKLERDRTGGSAAVDSH